MSIERLSGQGYAPIPQSISNTDTEDEDERLAMPNVNINKVNNKIHDNAETQGNGWCHSTNDTRNFGKDTADNQGGYRYCGDDVPIMVPEVETHDDFWKRRDTSLLRRCCLVFSIFLCFATVLVFLYVLPCDNTAICPPLVEKQPVIAWDKTLEGIELHGPISVVRGSPYSLIFLLRGQRFFANASRTLESRQIPAEGGGVLSMQGNIGTPLWWIPLGKMPVDVDCTTFDSVGSGTPDCIVIGNDLLISVDPTDGMTHWTRPIWTDSQLPLHVPDVNSDGIDDMIIATRLGFPHGSLVLLSGKTGKPLSQYIDPDCIHYYPMRLNGFTSSDNISYACEKLEMNGTTQTVNLTLSLSSFVEAKSLHFPKPNEVTTPAVTEIKHEPTETLQNFDNYTIQLTPYYRLNVDNSGPCPGANCRVKVNVTLEKSGKDDRVMWEHSSNNSFAMRPAIVPMGDKTYVTGFAMKFWQWDNEKETVVIEPGNIVKRRLSERVLMVFVNYIDVHVINASQEEIIQLCRGNDCQPSLKLQKRSIAIADLGGDETWELIHYQSSYSAKSSWLLTSKVQIVKLDTVVAQLTQTSIK